MKRKTFYFVFLLAPNSSDSLLSLSLLSLSLSSLLSLARTCMCTQTRTVSLFISYVDLFN